MTSGLLLIEQERLRQITREGFSVERDIRMSPQGELALAAACYAAPEPVYAFREGDLGGTECVDAWPLSWDKTWDKRATHGRLKQLAIAGALIAAELDRLLALENERVVT